MKKLLLFMSVLLIFPLSAIASPEVTAEVHNYDFGEVSQGSKVKYTFRFRNSGDGLLDISSVSSSCGCTAALLSSKMIAPGDMGEIKATFDSSRFRGRVTKTITMKTNAPAHPQVQFTLQGTVKELLGISTNRISWAWATRGQTGHSRVIVTNHSQQRIVLRQPQPTSPQLMAKLDRLRLAPGEKAHLDVSGTLLPGTEHLNGYVLVQTDFKPMPQLRISVSGRLNK